MNRNSYVTAALFVVFALLTVFYYALGDDGLNDAKVSSDQPAPGINVDVDSLANPIQQLRLELESQRTAKVDELKSVIASGESDAESKSDAKDSIAKINKEYEHAQALEAMIKAKGYEEVLVRVNEDAVQVIVQLATIEDKPTLEGVNELYMMAKTEFTNDPFVTIEFQPLN